jgi:putative N6-adenine-specific DNA methylase
MFTYQKAHRYFAQTAEGLEDLAAEELAELGATQTKTSYRGLYFCTDKAGLYRINYHSRLLSRVLAPLISFDCHSDRYLYKTASKIDWPELITPPQTFSVSAHLTQSNIRHSLYAARRVKDAVVDTCREKFGKRPSVNPNKPDVRLVLYLAQNRAVIYLDTSCESLHKRGYRLRAMKAPIRETVAAAILKMSQWDGETPLVDPMCGSGTLLAEALMLACRIPSGFLRNRFGFETLPDYDQRLWKSLKAQGNGRIRSLPDGLISGSDISREAVQAARSNLARLPHGNGVVLKNVPFQDIASLRNRIIISNPPFGVRMRTGSEAGVFAKALGDFLKKRCSGSTAYLFFGKRETIKLIGLRPSWKKALKSGGLDGRLVKYELY